MFWLKAIKNAIRILKKIIVYNRFTINNILQLYYLIYIINNVFDGKIYYFYIIFLSNSWFPTNVPCTPFLYKLQINLERLGSLAPFIIHTTYLCSFAPGNFSRLKFGLDADDILLYFFVSHSTSFVLIIFYVNCSLRNGLLLLWLYKM